MQVKFDLFFQCQQKTKMKNEAAKIFYKKPKKFWINKSKLIYFSNVLKKQK